MPTVNIKAFSHKKSTVVENGGPKLPTAAQLELGEIAINFAKGYETLSIKNNNNEIVTFTNDNYWINKELAIAAALNDLNDRKQDALEMDEVPTEGSENVVTSGGLYSYITEIEQVTAAALNDLNDRITSLVLSDDYAAAAQGTPPLAGDTYETAISKLHKVILDDELITSSALNDLNDRIDNLSLSEDYEAADPASEPAGGDTYEEAISKLHGAILENELATAGALNDLNTRISEQSLDDIPDGNIRKLSDYATIISVNSSLATKQDTLVSGTNIKTINNQPILGNGNITIQSGDTNVIETIKVNNTVLTPDTNKAVNISITNEGLGNGYAIQTDNGQTQNITASLTGYVLTINGRVSVKFNHNATYTPTLNINGTGAKTIKLADGSSLYQDYDYIKGGDIATFVYDGTYYRLVNVQRPKEFDSFLVPDPIELTLTDDSSSGIKVCSFSRNGATIHLPFWSTDTVLYNGVVYSDPQWSDAGPNLETYVFSNTSTEGIIQYLTIYHQFDPTYMGMVDEKWFVVTDEIVKTISIGASVLSEFYEPSSLSNEDLFLEPGDSYETAFSKLEKTINDNENITSAALTDLDSRLNLLHLPQSLDDIPDGSTRKLSDYATTALLATKQNTLVSGTNIKTINNESILGSGNITIQSGGSGDINIIESVKVNGTALTPDANKAVNITSIPASIVTQDATHRFVSDTEKTTWNGKQDALTCGELKGSMSRNDVSGSGNITVRNTSGEFPTVISEGTYKVVTYMSSTTQSYGLNVTFGGNAYSLTTSNGVIEDEREITITSNKTWSATISGSVASGTILIVKLYLISSNVSVLGLVAVSNDYDDLYNKPTIPSAVTESTVSGWGFTKNAGTITGITMNGASKGTSGVVDLGTVLTSETDPTVPAWAKAANKPSYTAQEVGALPNTYTPPVTSVNGQTGAVNLTIPSAPGTLNTTATTAQSTSSSEALSGNITLHKVAKTGTYGDLIGAKTKLSEFTNDSSYIANNTFYNTITLRSTTTTLNSEDIILQTGANKIELNPTGLTYRDTKHFLFDDAVITTDIEGGVDAHWSTLSDSQLLSAAVIKTKLDELPTVNNATLTIQKNGTTVNTFTANASSNVTANILVNELPTVSSSDNGKVLMVVNGAWSLVMPTSIYSGTSTPDSNTGNNGDIYLQTS